MILEELQQAPYVRPTIRLFGALDGHASDEVGLRPCRKIENDQANMIHSPPASSSALDLTTKSI
jgi:hypothetical protein